MSKIYSVFFNVNIKLNGHPMANQVLPATAFFLMEAVRFDFAVEIDETKYQTKTYLRFVW